MCVNCTNSSHKKWFILNNRQEVKKKHCANTKVIINLSQKMYLCENSNINIKEGIFQFFELTS